MYLNRIRILSAVVLLQLAWVAAQAGPLTVPNSFHADTPAMAAEVNGNFSAVKTAVDDNDSRIAALEAAVATLQSTVTAQAATISNLEAELATVNGSNVMALESYLTVDTVSDIRGPLVRFTGVNLQVVNGLRFTETANGLGNLIIGYDEVDDSGIPRCTLGWDSASNSPVTDEPTCNTAGGSWVTTGFKTGSHNLVNGSRNNYSRWGGLLSGKYNTITYDYAGVRGGYRNIASGPYSSICGGYGNTANSHYTSVSGGIDNIASGHYSSVTGGNRNTASGHYSSVSAGSHNSASDHYASISGGTFNTASGHGSSVSGGMNNTAAGTHASVSGGGEPRSVNGNSALTPYSSILGGTNQTTTASFETIPALP